MDQAPPASELTGPSSLATNVVVSGSSGSGGNVPTGAVSLYIATSAPSGWLICDGTAVSRTTYSTLFSIIGSTYGAGDGSTTFNLPDMRGRVPVGQGVHTDVSTLANNDGQSAANRRPKHRTTDAKTVSNTLTLPNHVHLPQSKTGSGGSSPQFDYTPGDGGATTGGGGSGFLPTTNPTSLPAIDGSVTLGGSIGTNNVNDALDAPSYIVLAFIIKT